MTKQVLITTQCLDCYRAVPTQHQCLLCFSLCAPQVEMKRAKCCEGAQLGQVTPHDQRNITDHIMSCFALKTEGVVLTI